jgi:hypothetical protein
VRDLDEINELHIHDMLVLEISLKLNRAMIQLGYEDEVPRLRIHVEGLSMIQHQRDERPELDKLRMTKSHPYISMIHKYYSDVEVASGNTDTLEQIWKETVEEIDLVCLIAGSRSVYTPEEEAQFAAFSISGQTVVEDDFPPELTVIGDRIWVEVMPEYHV